MKVKIRFNGLENKADVITPFLKFKDCKANDENIIVPNILKINYIDNLTCFCHGLDIAEIILSNICKVVVDDENNHGIISFPNSLIDILIETEIVDFNSIVDLVSNGKVNFINTDKKQLKAIVPLSQWLLADLTINYKQAFIRLKVNNYEINVNDGSALLFCNRVKQNPFISASGLNKYFDFGDIKLKPKIEYLCLWKMLKSDNGYKKYSNFINECNNDLNIIYDEGKKYKCEFNGGKVEFQLTSISDKYPKKVIVQIESIQQLNIIKSLQENLNIKNIDLVCKVTNIKLNTNKLLRDLNFYKSDNFFIFENIKDNLKIEYDIASNILNLKQDILLIDLTQKELNSKIDNVNKIINDLIKESE